MPPSYIRIDRNKVFFNFSLIKSYVLCGIYYPEIVHFIFRRYHHNFLHLLFPKKLTNMFRSHTCGELRESHIGQKITLSGWVQKTRDKGFVAWVDLRDRYGITQLVFDEDRTSSKLLAQARELGREFVVQVKGEVIERASENPDRKYRGLGGRTYRTQSF